MNKKIGYKLIAVVGLVSIIIIGMFSYKISSSNRNALIAQIDHHANQLSETVKSSTKYDMLLNQRERIHRTIDMIGKQEGIEKIRIFNKEGMIIYSSDKEEIEQLVDKRAESCYACHSADQPLEKLTINERTRIFVTEAGYQDYGIINPIYNEPACWESDCHAHDRNDKVLGVLDVTLSLKEVEEQIRVTQTRLVILATSAVLAISVIIWILVQYLVGKPVAKLVEATNAVAQGDFNYRIKIHRHDELGQLAHSFNVMTQELAEEQRKVYQYDKLASVGRLAAGVAHEINNPLTGILTYSSFLLKRENSNPEAKADLEVIVRETQRCRDIVKGLLDFSRQVPSQKSNVDINGLITKTVSILENQLNIKHVKIIKNLAEPLPSLRVDANQIQQVLINLINNAVDAIDKSGGEIRIATQLQEIGSEKHVELDVEDTGCGIERDKLERIFEPFFSTKGPAGTGLGLSVVWGILEKHNVTIDVESEVGKGTKFKVRFPLKSDGAGLIVEEKDEVEI